MTTRQEAMIKLPSISVTINPRSLEVVRESDNRVLITVDRHDDDMIEATADAISAFGHRYHIQEYVDIAGDIRKAQADRAGVAKR